jgi:peptidoglycan/xylan/chitin deacetylase (PgdA/CDA1 family)
MISFSFDDATASAASLGAEILEARGVRGTYFIAAGLTGQQGPTEKYADLRAIGKLAEAGHEIGCHTYSHLDCGQTLHDAALADVQRNAAALRGFRLETFAYPYGDVSFSAKKALSKQFKLLRAIHHGMVSSGVDLNQAPAVGIEGPEGEAVADEWLGRAARAPAWLILYTHDLGNRPSDWGATPEVLARLIDRAQALSMDVVTVAEGARRLGIRAGCSRTR